MGLSKGLRMLLIMNVVSSIVFIYVAIFINLYIWEQGQNIFDVSWYNMILLLAWGIAYSLSTRMLSKWSIKLLMAVSASFGAIAFLLLSLLELDNRLLWITLIGIPVGMMQGIFSTAHNLSITVLGQDREIAHYLAITNISNQILNMSIPLLTSQVIRLFEYAGSFVLMIIFLMLMMLLSLKLPPISLKDHMEPYQSSKLQLRYSNVFHFPQAKWFIISCLATGVILQFQSLFALLFTFSVTSDKTLIALLNTCYTAFALLALLAYRKLKVKESVWLMISVVFLGCGLLMMLIPLPLIRITSNVITTIGMFYFLTIVVSQQLKMTTGSLDIVKRSYMLVWREWMYVISRVGILLLMMKIDNFTDPLFIGLAIFVIMCLLAISFIQGKMMTRSVDVRADLR
jgi:MFS transporter, YQGE family, putative transporter